MLSDGQFMTLKKAAILPYLFTDKNHTRADTSTQGFNYVTVRVDSF